MARSACRRGPVVVQHPCHQLAQMVAVGGVERSNNAGNCLRIGLAWRRIDLAGSAWPGSRLQQPASGEKRDGLPIVHQTAVEAPPRVWCGMFQVNALARSAAAARSFLEACE